jgi:hypothetical protein
VTNPRYDVFKMDGGSPIWVGTADALDDAHAKVSELSDCPECVILDRITGERVVIKAGQAKRKLLYDLPHVYRNG